LSVSGHENHQRHLKNHREPLHQNKKVTDVLSQDERVKNLIRTAVRTNWKDLKFELAVSDPKSAFNLTEESWKARGIAFISSGTRRKKRLYPG